MKRGRLTPGAAILVLHDDGRWYVARLLGQHRDRATGDWRYGVRYTVDVGDAIPASGLAMSAGH
jgi:hypothetical protein